MITTKQLVCVLGLAILTAGCGTSGGGHPGSAMSENSAALPLNTGAVKQLQSALHAKGFYGGPIDGIAGPETRAALANYRHSEGMPRTAALDEKTLQSLIGTNTAANTHQTSASGSTARPGRMDADQIRNQLEAQGYSDVNDIRPWGNQDYTAKAAKNGQSYLLEVNGHTGQVFSAQ